MVGINRHTTVVLLCVLIVSIPAGAARSAEPSLTAVPQSALIDQAVTIEVEHCRPNQVVVLRAVCFDDGGQRWESRATFEANSEGKVDPGRMVPKYGTYQSAAPMGLFWSMLNDGGPGRLRWFTSNSLEPIEIVVQLELDGEVVDQQRLVRQRILPTVTRREIRESGLVGTLFLPGAEGPVGAIMVLGGSAGGLDEDTAALLASHGYATLALAYFNMESLPQDLAEIPLEYFEAAIDFLGRQDAVDAHRIAVQGISRGGELALLLGSTFPQIRAVVAYAPSGIVWGSCCSPETENKPAWTYKGKPITPLVSDEDDPAMQDLMAEERAKLSVGEPVAFTPGFRLSVEKATNLDAATIPVERTQGPIMLISGKADDLWPSTELAEIAVRRLRQHSFPFRFAHLSYQDAGHYISYPFQPTTVTEVMDLRDSAIVRFGGTPAGNVNASVDSWNHVLDFYRETLDRRRE